MTPQNWRGSKYALPPTWAECRRNHSGLACCYFAASEHCQSKVAITPDQGSHHQGNDAPLDGLTIFLLGLLARSIGIPRLEWRSVRPARIPKITDVCPSEKAPEGHNASHQTQDGARPSEPRGIFRANRQHKRAEAANHTDADVKSPLGLKPKTALIQNHFRSVKWWGPIHELGHQ
jgi:hypothetical protein